MDRYESKMERHIALRSSSKPPVIGNSIKIQLVLSIIVLFLLTFGICAFFTLATFDKLYSQSILESYVINTKKLREDLEKMNCSGTASLIKLDCQDSSNARDASSVTKRLTNFKVQINKLVEKTGNAQPKREILRDNVIVSIASLEGIVLYSSEQELIGQVLPMPVDETVSIDASTYSKQQNSKQQNIYSIVLPFHDKNKKKIATFVIDFNNNLINLTNEILLEQHKSILVIVLVIAIALLTLLIGILVSAKSYPKSLPKKKIAMIMFTIVCAAQIVSSIAGAIVFKDNYSQFSKQKTEILAELVKANIEDRLNIITSIQRLSTTNDLNHNISEISPEAEKQMFTFYDKDGWARYNISYAIGSILQFEPINDKSAAISRLEDDGKDVVQLDVRSRGKTVGYLSTSIDLDQLYDKLFGIGLDVLITVVISVLCLVELLILVFKYLEKISVSHTQSETVHYSVMRPTIFLFLFGIDLSAALIPLQMEKLYEPILGLPKDVVLGLPVSAMFLTVGITFIISGAWMDRRGWHEPFLIGVLLTGASKFYAWLAPDALQFIIAMAGIGTGYGLALMAAQGFVMANTTDKDKAHGIAYFFAGVYAGSIGGIAIGAMLAERIGYDLVFLIGSLCIFMSFFYAIFFLRRAFRAPHSDILTQPMSAQKRWGFMRFLMDRNVLVLVFFCSIPSAIAVIGFLNYFSPLYLNRLGISESIIGGVLTLYGISMVYISPIISRRIDATDRKDHFIVIGCMLGGCAFLSFYFLSGLVATIIAVLLLGLSGSCLQSSQTTYALQLKATRELGVGKAIAIVRATSRVGQMLGPMIFSWLVILNDTEQAITYFGFVYFLMALLFMKLTKREDKVFEKSGMTDNLTDPGEVHG